MMPIITFGCCPPPPRMTDRWDREARANKKAVEGLSNAPLSDAPPWEVRMEQVGVWTSGRVHTTPPAPGPSPVPTSHVVAAASWSSDTSRRVSGRHGRMETGLAQYLHGYGLSASSPSQGLDPESPQLLFPMGNSTGLAFGEFQPPEVEKLARISGRHTDGQGTVLELGTGVHSLGLGPGYASRRPRFQKTAHHFNAITEEKLGGRFSEKLEWPWLVRLHFGCGRGTRRWRPKETMMNGHP